jgi:Stress responsive A/B Barrel Domain
MKKTIFLATFLLGIALAGCHQSTSTISSGSRTPATEIPDEARIQRIVCFKFKPGITAEARQKHMRGFAGLKDSISYILSYHAGPTVKADMGELEYDVMHYTTYRNEEEIKLYAVHPVHQRFIRDNKAVWEKVLVINSAIGEAGESR